VKVEELVGSLQTYELFPPQPKRKTLDFKTVSKEASDSSDEESSEDDELDLLSKKFRKFFETKKGNDRTSPPSFLRNLKVIPMEPPKERRTKPRRKRTLKAFNVMSVWVYGHIRAECPNYKKTKGKECDLE
jgi:hypothetical protein